jgi:hypothetical protein
MQLIEWEVNEEMATKNKSLCPKNRGILLLKRGIGTENKQKVAVRILTNRVSLVLKTPERKSGAENAGQTYSRNRRKNLADRKKIIRKPSSNPWIHQH